MSKRHQAGFTIIELLIATAVFSTVLLAISAAIIQIGRLYYKGVTSAQTQDVARTIMDDVSQSIQYGSTRPTWGDTIANGSDPQSKAICIDGRQYSFRLGQQRLNANHALVVRKVSGGCDGTPAQNLQPGVTPAPTGEEMLAPHMRVSNLDVKPFGDPDIYRIVVRIVYGDDDLLCSSALNNCSSIAKMSEAQINAARDLRCKNIRSGTQFCAVSELTTLAERRLK